jgi:hypothetical protein
MVKIGKRIGAAVACVGAILATTVAPPAIRYVSIDQFLPTSDPAPFSPAGCAIQYVSDAHPSNDPKNGVRVAAKVNSRTQCKVAVPWQTLQVTIVDLTTGERLNTQATAENKDYVLNQSAFLPCTKTGVHTYKGFAFGTSAEGGKTTSSTKKEDPRR